MSAWPYRNIELCIICRATGHTACVPPCANARERVNVVERVTAQTYLQAWMRRYGRPR